MNLTQTNRALLDAHNRLISRLAELEAIGKDVIDIHGKGDLADAAREDVAAALANLDVALEALRLASDALANAEEANRYLSASGEVA